MKTKLILMAVLLTSSSVLFAGSCDNEKRKGPHGEGAKGKQFRQHVLSDLNMSEAQQKSFDIIMANKKEKMKAAMDVIHNDTKSELSEILTEEQMQLLEEKQQKKGKFKKRMKKREQK